MMRKKELIDAVTDRAGVKKRDCKPVIEAMLAVLGEAIAEDRELNLQPFGKLKVNRRKDVPNGNVFICRLRQNNKNPDQSSEDQIAAKGDVDPKA
ncbi:MAG: HU family DNA-binding protein [Paracoccaceae bacterium]